MTFYHEASLWRLEEVGFFPNVWIPTQRVKENEETGETNHTKEQDGTPETDFDETQVSTYLIENLK